MQVVLEIIGAIIVVGIFALGVEKYIEFLKSRSSPPKQPDAPNNGDKNA